MVKSLESRFESYCEVMRQCIINLFHDLMHSPKVMDDFNCLHISQVRESDEDALGRLLLICWLHSICTVLQIMRS